MIDVSGLSKRFGDTAALSGIDLAIARGERIVVIVTHEMPFAREIADRVLFMEGGRVVEQEPPAGLFDAPRGLRTRAFLRRVR